MCARRLYPPSGRSPFPRASSSARVHLKELPSGAPLDKNGGGGVDNIVGVVFPRFRVESRAISHSLPSHSQGKSVVAKIKREEKDRKSSSGYYTSFTLVLRILSGTLVLNMIV